MSSPLLAVFWPHCRRAVVRSSARRSSTTTSTTTASTTIDPAEIHKFAALSSSWWKDDAGPFVGLHRLNDVRVPIIRRALLGKAPPPPSAPPPTPTAAATDDALLAFRWRPAVGPLHGKTIIDIGCGGGILSEALARLGATVLGVDAAPENIAAARLHAALDPYDGDPHRLLYECTTAEAVAARGATFDGVIASEVLEHVRDPPAFLDACAALVKVRGRPTHTSSHGSPTRRARVAGFQIDTSLWCSNSFLSAPSHYYACSPAATWS